MRTADLPSYGVLDTTVPSPGDPTYQQECLALEIRQTMKNLSDAGFQFQAAQVSDVEDFQTDLGTFLENAYARETEILNTGLATTVANLPDVLSIGAAMMSGGSSAAIACIGNILLKRVFGDSSAYSGHLGQADNDDIVSALEDIASHVETLKNELPADLDDVTGKLDNIETAVLQVLNTFNINIHSDEDSASFSVGPYDA